jgi:thiamine pyrophosphate-dependent acetolactate synthase large subunit-like protein
MFNELIIAGRGVRIANAIPELIKLSHRKMVVTTILGKDLLDSMFSRGTIGIKGTANHMIEWADKITVIGASLPVAQIGYDLNDSFRNKQVTIVNVEKPNNLIKAKFIKMDAKQYLTKWLKQLGL